MLTVDLGRLARDGRVRVDADLPPDAEDLNALEFEFAEPVRVRMLAQRVGVGEDVLVRGTVQSALRQQCRRCLEPLETEVDEEISLYYEAGIDRVRAEQEEVYALPARGDLDLGPALREQMTLALERYPVCREECRGLCPQCGANLNEVECECEPEATDDRWAALREINQD